MFNPNGSSTPKKGIRSFFQSVFRLNNLQQHHNESVEVDPVPRATEIAKVADKAKNTIFEKALESPNPEECRARLQEYEDLKEDCNHLREHIRLLERERDRAKAGEASYYKQKINQTYGPLRDKEAKCDSLLKSLESDYGFRIKGFGI